MSDDLLSPRKVVRVRWRGGRHAFAGAGDDYVEGNDGNDYLFGNDGSDKLVGGLGLDFFDGGAGADKIHALDGLIDIILSDPEDGVDADPFDIFV